jgi:hypothetical protein
MKHAAAQCYRRLRDASSRVLKRRVALTDDMPPTRAANSTRAQSRNIVLKRIVIEAETFQAESMCDRAHAF